MDMNKSIKCMVESCQHHANAANYCCLDCITVGTHECNPSVEIRPCRFPEGQALPLCFLHIVTINRGGYII